MTKICDQRLRGPQPWVSLKGHAPALLIQGSWWLRKTLLWETRRLCCTGSPWGLSGRCPSHESCVWQRGKRKLLFTCSQARGTLETICQSLALLRIVAGENIPHCDCCAKILPLRSSGLSFCNEIFILKSFYTQENSACGGCGLCFCVIPSRTFSGLVTENEIRSLEVQGQH